MFQRDVLSDLPQTGNLSLFGVKYDNLTAKNLEAKKVNPPRRALTTPYAIAPPRVVACLPRAFLAVIWRSNLGTFGGVYPGAVKINASLVLQSLRFSFAHATKIRAL